MKKRYTIFASILIISVLLIFIPISSCKKIKKINNDPEIEPLRHGFKTMAAVGYCGSLAKAFSEGEELPDNIVLHSDAHSEGTHTFILIATINETYPLPYNSSVGEITIGGIWDEDGGVITVVYTDIDIIESEYEFRGIQTIPVMEIEEGKLMTVVAEQDITVGYGSDTMLHLNMSNIQISMEMERLEAATLPDDAFTAVGQNVWFITVEQKGTVSDIYDDEYTIYGGGQIAEITSQSGGLLYHAMIGAKFIPSTCDMNPVSGIGFIQNLKVGSKNDLGHVSLSFHSRCDGKAYVELATGKYLTSYHRNVNLNFN